MFNPPHPASILREDIFPELGITVTEAAKQLGVSRVQLSRVLNEHAAISPDLALRHVVQTVPFPFVQRRSMKTLKINRL